MKIPHFEDGSIPLQPIQSKLQAAISGAAKAGGFSTPLYEANQKDHQETTFIELAEEVCQLSSKPACNHAESFQISQEPKTARELTLQLTACLKTDLNRGELKTFRLLHEVALIYAQKRSYSPKTTQVCFFCPKDIVALALGVNQSTVWRHLKVLLELRLLDARPHMTDYKGHTLTDGYLWCIKLNPYKGKTPKLSYEDLNHKYRDLEADVKSGRTAYKEMQESLVLTKDLKGTELILTWALTPLSYQTPVSSDSCISYLPNLESLFDLPFHPKQERNKQVDKLARSIAFTLADAKSHQFYCQLLWNLLRKHDQGQDYLPAVYDMLIRARTDQLEGFALSAGALFVSRLKEWSGWDDLKRTQPTRVGGAIKA